MGALITPETVVISDPISMQHTLAVDPSQNPDPQLNYHYN